MRKPSVLLLCLWACLLFSCSNGPQVGPPSASSDVVVRPPTNQNRTYDCRLGMLEAQPMSSSPLSKVTLTWMETRAGVQSILVSDERYDRTPSALILYRDTQTLRIDQVRDREGKPWSPPLNGQVLSPEESIARSHYLAGFLLLESAPLAIRQKLSSFEAMGISFGTDLDSASPDPVGSAPLPRRVSREGLTLCEQSR